MRLPKGGIGFFDSGIGGLTVMDACQRVVKGERFYYYGDNKHAPYGNLPQEKIRKYVFRAFKKFYRLKVCAVVIACNTVTAVCIEELRRKFPFPIVGAEPALLLALKGDGKVLVLTTKATFESARFLKLQKQARENYPHADVECCPCVELAGAIEKWIENPQMDIECYLPKGSPDRVVLGCTHYLYVKEQISRFYGCETIDGNEGIARRLQSVLEREKSSKTTFRPLRAKPRPQGVKSGIFLPFLTTFIYLKTLFKSINKNANKCLRIISPKCFKQKERSVFFMGSGRRKNRKIWEQMFAFFSQK